MKYRCIQRKVLFGLSNPEIYWIDISYIYTTPQICVMCKIISHFFKSYWEELIYFEFLIYSQINYFFMKTRRATRLQSWTCSNVTQIWPPPYGTELTLFFLLFLPPYPPSPSSLPSLLLPLFLLLSHLLLSLYFLELHLLQSSCLIVPLEGVSYWNGIVHKRLWFKDRI